MNPLVLIILEMLLAKGKELGLEWVERGAELVRDALRNGTEIPDDALVAWLRLQAEATE